MSPTARFSSPVLFLAGLLLITPVWNASAQVAKSPPEHGKVILQLSFTHQFQFAGYYAAQYKGFFAEEGVEVEVRDGTFQRRPYSELIGGRAEYGIGSATYLLDRLNGAPLVLVTPIFQHSMLALMVPRDSDIRAPEDLRDRRLAMAKSGRYPEIAAMFAAEGLAPEAYIRVEDKWDVQEIMTGEADAQIVFLTDLPFDMEKAGFPVRLMRASDYGVDFYGDSLFTTETELARNPERVAAMRRAVLRGWAYALGNPEDVISYIERTYPDRPANVTRERLRFEAREIARLINADLLDLGHINPQRWRRTGEIFVELGMAKDNSRFDGFIAPFALPKQPEISRRVLLIGGGVMSIALLALLANWRLQRLVEKRTRELQAAQREQHELFDLAPAPIVVEDIRDLAAELDRMRAEGVMDIAAHVARHPEQIQRLFELKRIHAANRRALEMAGFGTAQEMEVRLRELMTEQSFNAFVQELVAIWEGRENLTIEKIYQLQGGRRAHLLLNWSVRHVEGQLDYSRVRLVFTDITEIKRAEQALLESEERYRSLFETTPNPMYIFDVGTLKIIAVNEAAVQRYGYTREEFATMTVLDLRPPDEGARLRASLENFPGEAGRQRGAHSAGLWRHCCKDGTLLIVEVYTHTLMFNGRECVLSLPFDITAKLATERALRESEARHRELFENAVGGVYRSTPQGRYISVNPALARLYGFNDPEEMLAWNERERGGIAYAIPDQHRKFAELIAETGKVENFESQIIDRHGNVLWITETSRAVRDDAGNLLYYEGFVMDITARRRLELEMQRASKLEAVGILAGGIAHDFNNILTVVLGNVTLAEMDTEPHSTIQKMLRDAKKATLRARDLTQQLLTFAKGGDPVRAAVALPELLRESADFALHGSQSKGEFQIAADLWPANADKGQLSQVLQNLVINAAQAMPHGGIVRIRAENATLDVGEKPSLRAGEYVKISVADTGVGIAPEHIGKIFDPYFTTKPQGSGLGLATVYSIIRKHQGHIEVESEVGVGTTFEFWLPSAGSPSSDVPPELMVETSLRARVLFMDDEQPIREMATMFIERFGGECVAVADGMAAIRAYSEAQATGHAFDVVVMDLTVPGGMGGREAMALLREIDPSVRAIVSSGYSRDPVLGNYRAHGFCGILPKPYGLEQLRKVLLEVMTARQSATPF